MYGGAFSHWIGIFWIPIIGKGFRDRIDFSINFTHIQSSGNQIHCNTAHRLHVPGPHREKAAERLSVIDVAAYNDIDIHPSGIPIHRVAHTLSFPFYIVPCWRIYLVLCFLHLSDTGWCLSFQSPFRWLTQLCIWELREKLTLYCRWQTIAQLKLTLETRCVWIVYVSAKITTKSHE